MIGNGFTSQLIEDYSDTNMKFKLLRTFKDEYNLLNDLFKVFRMSDIKEDEIYDYGGGLYPSETLFPSESLYPRDDSILYNDKIKEHVTNKLMEYGFEEYEAIYNKYFIQYGLVFEIIESEIKAIENLLKVNSMFEIIGKIQKEKQKEIIRTANQIYYNEGKYGLKDTNLIDSSKIKCKRYFSQFDYIFTTNYDLILDDICDNEDKVYHLHGGFNFEHPNLKATRRLTDNDAYIVWGIDGEKKYKTLSAGWDFGNFRFDAVRYGQSLLADYFTLLEQGEFDEIHIFGYSGQNDQHINKRIVANTSIKYIYFYCDPQKVNVYKFQKRVEELFQSTTAEIKFEPWSKVWQQINEN